MKLAFVLISLLFTVKSLAQTAPDIYNSHISLAEGYFANKDYPAAAKQYSEAFASFGWKGYANDRYNAACAWALAGNSDSAFSNLDRLITKINFSEYERLLSDTNLNPLHDDQRWKPLLASVKSNKEKAEKNLDRALAHELDSIFEEDQKYRRQSSDNADRYERDSKQVKDVWKKIGEIDSMNLIRVREILDQRGWLGPDIVGEQGNSTLFLVIQHADLATQEKYLPMLKEAVANKNARASHLALLIDRVEMRNGRPQIYGSQITFKDGKQIIHPIVDEKNVNKRREEMGLGPMEDYAKQFGIEYVLPE